MAKKAPPFTPASQRDDDTSPRNNASLKRNDQLDDDDVLENFERDYREASGHYRKWRRAAKKYYKTYGGDPWEAADRVKLAKTERPAANLNVSLATINAIVGSDMLERRETRWGGEDLGYLDAAKAEWLTRTVRHQFARTNGHRSDSQVLHDGLITGLGFSRSYMDNRRYPFRVRVEHLHPWQCLPDPEASETNLTDRRFLIYEDIWDRDRATGRFGAAQVRRLRSGASALGEGGSQAAPRVGIADNYRTKNDGLSFADPDGRKLKIFEYEYLTFEPWVAFTDVDGLDRAMPKAEFAKHGAMVAGQGQELVGLDYPQEVRYVAFIGAASSKEGHLTLLERKPAAIDVSQFACYTGFRWVDVDTGRVHWFGLMHVIHEPQLLYAKTLTNLIEYFARGAKGGAFIERGALDDPNQAKQDWATPGALIILNDGAIAQEKVLERKPVTWPASMDALMRMLREGITDISAVSDWLKGTATQERSNVLISNLQSQSMTVLAPALDPMSGFRMQQGQAVAQLAIKYLSVQALDKILGNVELPGITHERDPASPGQCLRHVDPMTGQPLIDPETQRPLVDEDGNPPAVQKTAPDGTPITPGYILKNETDLFEYDCQVDLGSASPTARQATFAMLTQHGVLDKMFEAGLPPQDVLPELLKMSPLPPEVSKPLADKFKALLQAPTVEAVMAQLQRMSPEDRQQILMALTGQPTAEAPAGAPAPVVQ